MVRFKKLTCPKPIFIAFVCLGKSVECQARRCSGARLDFASGEIRSISEAPNFHWRHQIFVSCIKEWSSRRAFSSPSCPCGLEVINCSITSVAHLTSQWRTFFGVSYDVHLCNISTVRGMCKKDSGSASHY
jgi:hypothetical protein